MRKRYVLLISCMMITLLCSFTSYAADNADSGTGGTEGAAANKGYYRDSEYMYKISIYVAKSDQTDEDSNLKNDWYRIGSPMYVQPSTFILSSAAIGGGGNKTDYQSGTSLSPTRIKDTFISNPPPIPIVNYGNINAVKSYFGDTNTLNAFIDAIADQSGKTRTTLVSGLNFTINGVSGKQSPEDILPIKINGEYGNRVSWLIIYEPVVIAYLKDRTTVLAFTATEFALAQKLGYFDFFFGPAGQYIAGVTHSDLPNGVFLEESWFNYPVVSALPDGTYWNNDRMIAGGGWGMRMLGNNASNVIENDIFYDYEYRVDTDVITSVRIQATADITPDNRHTSQEAYKNPTDNTATVAITANGYTKRMDVVIPKGGSQLAWIKWHTPSTPGQVEIQINATGNPAALIDGVSRSATLWGKVVDLEQNEPPNPIATDRNDSFVMPKAPERADKTYASWGIYRCDWAEDWVWHEKWEWEANWQKDYYTYRHPGGCIDQNGDGEDDYCLGHRRYRWVDEGQWVDHGEWVDEGEWVYAYTPYHAALSAQMKIMPSSKVPTRGIDRMKSGYGIEVKVDSDMTTNAPSSHLTYAQNVITYFPEFNYQKYWRLLNRMGNGEFEFKKNVYSTYNSKVHFTPAWYPDGPYVVAGQVLDLWTPEGMLREYVDDTIQIEGNLFQDWHIGPQ